MRWTKARWRTKDLENRVAYLEMMLEEYRDRLKEHRHTLDGVTNVTSKALFPIGDRLADVDAELQ